MKRVFFMFLATLALVACDKGGSDTPSSSSADADRTVYADEIYQKDAVSFSALQAWTATVSDVTTRATNTNVEWLQLSAYSGAAGAQSLSLSLMPNFTGESRKAEIKIAFGETIITSIVEQKSTTEDNKAPQYKTVKRMNSSRDGKASGYIAFTYDNQQRVTSCSMVRAGGDEDSYIITYSASQLVMTETRSGETDPVTTIFTLDSKGKITDSKIDNSGVAAAKYTYDTENRLTYHPYDICPHNSTDGSPASPHTVFRRNVWEGPNIKTTYEESGHVGINDVIFNYEYTDKLNNGLASIDLTGGYGEGIEHIIFKEGSFGKKGRNLISKETGTYIKDWTYEFDKDGNLTKFAIACNAKGDVWTESYEIIYN